MNMNHMVKIKKYVFKTKIITVYIVEAIDSTKYRFQDCHRDSVHEIGLTK